MEQEEVFREDSSDSPHFGDEQTLRDAQPVVPLADIRSNQVWNRVLMSLALVIALGLGAGGALLLVHLQQPVSGQAPTARPERNNSTTGEDPSVAAAGEEATGEEEEMMEVGSSEDSTSEAEPSANKPRRKRIVHVANSDTNARIDTDPNARVSSPAMAKTDDASQKPVLVDQWEEKRSRRVTANEPARANVRRRDLFRIRDIFEGARP